MKLLIDTNIILDMVLKRENCDTCMELFRKIRAFGIEAYITASSVTDLFYIIRKETHDTIQTYTIMENIFKLTAILSVTENDIRDAFQERWKDFEDCVQYRLHYYSKSKRLHKYHVASFYTKRMHKNDCSDKTLKLFYRQ